MHPRIKSSLLWGIVGIMAFLVLARGYGAIVGSQFSLPVTVGVAIAVGLVTASAAYLFEPALFAKRQT